MWQFGYNACHMLKLEAKIRERKSKTAGKEMSAVYYGPKEKSTPISISPKDFKKLWQSAGESSVFSLSVGGKDLEALIHDVDTHPVTGEPRHADFYIIEKGKKVSVNVPLEFTGVAPAVKELAGILVKVLYEIEIEALPKDLPHNIEVDISALIDFEKHIFVKDIKLPSGVEVLTNPEEIVVMVQEAKEEVIEETVAPDLSSIEVEKKGKEAETAEEAEPAGE